MSYLRRPVTLFVMGETGAESNPIRKKQQEKHLTSMMPYAYDYM